MFIPPLLTYSKNKQSDSYSEKAYYAPYYIAQSKEYKMSSDYRKETMKMVPFFYLNRETETSSFQNFLFLYSQSESDQSDYKFLLPLFYSGKFYQGENLSGSTNIIFPL